MTTRLQQRRARLRAEYGFDFPEEFYRFWDFVTRLSPLDPLHALSALEVTLVGPFEILSGRFDGQVPKHSQLLHWRYWGDPPEFFTVLAGGGDGLHWGYVLDDPDRGPAGCVASYFARDAYEFSLDGDSLFEAMRLHLEYQYRDLLDYEEGESLEPLDRLRDQLTKYATGDRAETDEEYTDLYGGMSSRNEHVVAATWGNLGVVAAPEQYQPLSVPDKRLWKAMFRNKFDFQPLVEEARAALTAGRPATALKLGRDLWVSGNAERMEAGAALMDEAYAALGREVLRRVLVTHHASRDLPTVDVLDERE